MASEGGGAVASEGGGAVGAYESFTTAEIPNAIVKRIRIKMVIDVPITNGESKRDDILMN